MSDFVTAITAEDADDALLQILTHPEVNLARESRNGPTLEIPNIAVVTYPNPLKRVSFLPARDCNPFFALWESLWMIYGGDDLASILYFNTQFGQYSDDGKLIRGSAYGKRWRTWFGHDQIETAAKEFEKSGSTRRAVISQWDPASDPIVESKDVPCNVMTLFLERDGQLDMTVFNRSNDAIYGLAGSNIVHFSILHEYMALRLGLPLGKYQQVSNCLHVYLEFDVFKRMQEYLKLPLGEWTQDNPYDMGIETTPLLQPGESLATLDNDIHLLMKSHRISLEEKIGGLFNLKEEEYHTQFFHKVFLPMMRCWRDWKEKKGARVAVGHVREAMVGNNSDWLFAAEAWMIRRVKA